MCQLGGEQPCGAAWQSRGRAVLQAPSTATHLLAGGRQARRLQFSWQESRAKRAAVQCLVPRIRPRRRGRGRVGAAGLTPHMCTWPNPVRTQNLRQVPRAAGSLAAPPPPAPRPCCPEQWDFRAAPPGNPSPLGWVPPLSAGWVGFRGPQGTCPANYRLCVIFSRRILKSTQDWPCHWCVLCFGD